MSDITDVNASAGNIGSDEDLDLPRLEIPESLFSVLLSSVPVNTLHHDILHGTLGRDLGGLGLPVHEDDHLEEKLY